MNTASHARRGSRQARLWATALVAGSLLAPATLLASHPEAPLRPNQDWAEVLEVSPYYRTVERPVDQRVCWDEKVYRDEPRYVSATPTIIGSIIGGVVGNQFGGGRGRDLATFAGVALGGSVATDIQAQRIRERSYIGVERRCETERHWESSEEIAGYEVTYQYQGQVYVTDMAHDPGDRIRVEVSVRPAGG